MQLINRSVLLERKHETLILRHVKRADTFNGQFGHGTIIYAIFTRREHG
jgi:hypothetical protein